MNILIVGNGFDLSHYLPTKYDHFMDAMNVIENKDTGGLPNDLENRPIDECLRLLNSTFDKRENQKDETQSITFEELFNKTRDPNFLEKTKEFYKTSNIVLTQKSVLEFQYRLAKNCWYQYFKLHVIDIKTWIDFEKKIEDVLLALSLSYPFFKDLNFKNKSKFRVSELKTEIGFTNYQVLSVFNLFDSEESVYQGIDTIFCNGCEAKNGLSFELVLNFIQKELDEFIKIFNLYLELVIDRLEPKSQFKIEANNWVQPDHIFSFNYTNTFQKFYQNNVKTEYLHGKFGEKQNIVLGISDLEDESLKNLKAYGFTKYHQKLFKDTDYLFLDELSEIRKIIEVCRGSFSNEVVSLYVWGHSLDYSDKEYIIDIFRLNEFDGRNIQLTIYYFNKSAKFSLLNNLLAILGKETVEKWMKNKWLIFERNPEVKLVETIPE